MRLAAHAEGYSTHPIAASIRDAFEKEFHFSVSLDIVRDVEELSGKGIRATIEDSVILAGNEKLMAEFGIEYTPATTVGTVIYLEDQTRKKYLGSLVISDTIKEDTTAALTDLKRAGVTQTAMLTGDHKVIAEKVASTVSLPSFFRQTRWTPSRLFLLRRHRMRLSPSSETASTTHRYWFVRMSGSPYSPS